MHRSRLHVAVIDSPREVAEREVDFWAAALGSKPTPEAGTPFTVITRFGGGELLAHQRLQDGDARIHLDVETDDPPAEVARLEALGAVVIGAHDECMHLRDPAGLIFCVVPVQSEDFEERATTWK